MAANPPSKDTKVEVKKQDLKVEVKDSKKEAPKKEAPKAAPKKKEEPKAGKQELDPKLVTKPEPLETVPVAAVTKTQEAQKYVERPVELGHFVYVAKGDHTGRYGVLIQWNGDGTGVVRTRDNDTARLEVKIENLVASKSGRR